MRVWVRVGGAVRVALGGGAVGVSAGVSLGVAVARTVSVAVAVARRVGRRVGVSATAVAVSAAAAESGNGSAVRVPGSCASAGVAAERDEDREHRSSAPSRGALYYFARAENNPKGRAPPIRAHTRRRAVAGWLFGMTLSARGADEPISEDVMPDHLIATGVRQDHHGDRQLVHALLLHGYALPARGTRDLDPSSSLRVRLAPDRQVPSRRSVVGAD